MDKRIEKTLNYIYQKFGRDNILPLQHIKFDKDNSPFVYIVPWDEAVKDLGDGPRLFFTDKRNKSTRSVSLQ